MKSKKFHVERRFMAAIILAGLFGTDRWSVKDLMVIAGTILRAVVSRAGRVDAMTFYRRMRACWRCPIFYVPLQTCGSPLADNPNQGCWCHMPSKAKLEAATCWIDDNTTEDYEDNGWKTI